VNDRPGALPCRARAALEELTLPDDRRTVAPCAGAWALFQSDDMNRRLPAMVPGCVHTDLLSAGVIDDPWYADREKDIHWVYHRDGSYERELDMPAELLDHDHVELCCDGLNTLAAVWLNGVEVGRADNMFRRWRFDVKRRPDRRYPAWRAHKKPRVEARGRVGYVQATRRSLTAWGFLRRAVGRPGGTRRRSCRSPRATRRRRPGRRRRRPRALPRGRASPPRAARRA